MWVATTDFPTAASHPFYARLNQLLREHGFDDFAEAQCATFYAETMGRPGLSDRVRISTRRVGSGEHTCVGTRTCSNDCLFMPERSISVFGCGRSLASALRVASRAASSRSARRSLRCGR